MENAPFVACQGLTICSPLVQVPDNARKVSIGELQSGKSQTAFRLHPGLAAAAAPASPSLPVITVHSQDGAAQSAAKHGGQMFSALPTTVFPAQDTYPANPYHANGTSHDSVNNDLDHHGHLSNPQGHPYDDQQPQPTAFGSQALDGQPLSDFAGSHAGSLAGSQAGSLQSDISSASAMYRRLRTTGQPIIRQGSLGPRGSLDSAQSVRIAEHLSSVRARNASLGPTPMEDVTGAGPDINPDLLASPEMQAAATSCQGGGTMINDSGCGFGGAMPAASGKAIVAAPSPRDVHMEAAAHVVRSRHNAHTMHTCSLDRKEIRKEGRKEIVLMRATTEVDWNVNVLTGLQTVHVGRSRCECPLHTARSQSAARSRVHVLQTLGRRPKGCWHECWKHLPGAAATTLMSSHDDLGLAQSKPHCGAGRYHSKIACIWWHMAHDVVALA